MAIYGDGWGEVALATSSGHRQHRQRQRLRAVDVLPRGRERRHADRLRCFRRPRVRRARSRQGRGRRRAPGHRSCSGRPNPRAAACPVILDPDVTAAFLGVIGFPLTWRGVLKGRSLFANRVGETVGERCGHPRVGPDRHPLVLGRTTIDGEGLASRRVPADRERHLLTASRTTPTRRGVPGTSPPRSAVRGMKTTPSVAAVRSRSSRAPRARKS